MARVVGFDPGSYHLGWAVFNDGLSVGCEQFKDRHKSDRAGRLSALWEVACKILKKHNPEVVGIETAWSGPFPKVALSIGEVRGILIAASFLANARVINVTPTQVKQGLTGAGKATKAAMILAAEIQFGLQCSEHEADAIGVGLAAIAKIKEERLAA